MVKYLLLIGLVLFVSHVSAGGYGKKGGYGHGSGYGMTYKGYGDGGYGSSNLMAELLGRKGFGGGGYRGFGGGHGGGGIGQRFGGGHGGGGIGQGFGGGHGGGGIGQGFGFGQRKGRNIAESSSIYPPPTYEVIGGSENGLVVTIETGGLQKTKQPPSVTHTIYAGYDNDIQNIQNITQKTKDRATRSRLKIRGELMFSGRTPVVEYQNVVRNVPTIEYQNVPQVQYQTQTVQRQIPIYAQTYPNSGPSTETGWLSGNSPPVYSGGSQPIYSGGSPGYPGGSPGYPGGSPGYPGGSPIYQSGSAPVYSSGGSINTYPGGVGGSSPIVRGDGTFVPSPNTYPQG